MVGVGAAWVWATRARPLEVQTAQVTQHAAGAQASNLIRSVGFGIAALMGIGAVFAAVLTMYTAVATRTREVATLCALGFNSFSVVVSVLVEALGLGAIGGVLGGLLAYGAFNGYQTSTINFQTFSQVAFAFAVTPALLAQGLIYACSWAFWAGCFLPSAPQGFPSSRRCASCRSYEKSLRVH